MKGAGGRGAEPQRSDETPLRFQDIAAHIT